MDEPLRQGPVTSLLLLKQFHDSIFESIGRDRGRVRLSGTPRKVWLEISVSGSIVVQGMLR